MHEAERAEDRVARNARTLVDAIGERAGELARLARLKLDLMRVEGQIDREFRDLGERVYDLTRIGDPARVAHDPVAEMSMARLRHLHAERLVLSTRIGAARAPDYAGQDAGSAPIRNA